VTSVGICSVSIGISIRTTDEFGSVGRIDVVDWRPEWPENFNRECIRLAAFEAVGNMYVPEHEDRMPERRYFRRALQPPRTYHVHCFVLGSSEWNRHILFRDRLRASTALVDAYGELKRELARNFAGYRRGYTEAKSAFIASALSDSTTLRYLTAPSR